jgi:hypothetical protein
MTKSHIIRCICGEKYQINRDEKIRCKCGVLLYLDDVRPYAVVPCDDENKSPNQVIVERMAAGKKVMYGVPLVREAR